MAIQEAPSADNTRQKRLHISVVENRGSGRGKAARQLVFCRGLPQKDRSSEASRPFMIDFVAARRMMVDGQVRTADITDPRIVDAMLDVPRERFFPEDKASLAYLDLDVAVTNAGEPVRRLLK